MTEPRGGWGDGPRWTPGPRRRPRPGARLLRAERERAWPGAIELRREFAPRWPLRMPGGGADGVARTRGGVLQRLLHTDDGRGVWVRAAQPEAGRVVIGARAGDETAAAWGIARMRLVVGVDDDLSEFVARYSGDPLIGSSVRAMPWLRPRRRPIAFEALAWAICEQLIRFDDAVDIERRIVARWGRRCEATGLRDVPSAAAIAGVAPAELQACGLSAARAIALRRAAIEIARGRVDLHDGARHEDGWARLRAIPTIGSWTLDVLATAGQGRLDRIPAGDLGYLKAVGLRLSGGDPRVRAEEAQVRELFAPYAPYQALAGLHFLRASNGGRPLPLSVAA